MSVHNSYDFFANAFTKLFKNCQFNVLIMAPKKTSISFIRVRTSVQRQYTHFRTCDACGSSKGWLITS